MPTAIERPDRSGRLADDAGSATVEFLGLTLILLIPVVYLMLYLSQVQAAAFAAVASADQAAKVTVAEANGLRGGAAQGYGTVLLTMKDYGVTADRFTSTITCSVDDCLTRDPGEIVTVHVSVRVPLPVLPQLGSAPLSPVTVEADARQAVPRF